MVGIGWCKCCHLLFGNGLQELAIRLEVELYRNTLFKVGDEGVACNYGIR